MFEERSEQAGYAQITVSIDAERYELVTDFLAGELPSGFQEIETDAAHVFILRFYLKKSSLKQFRARWEGFYRERFSHHAPEFAVEFIPDRDWQEKFRRETKAVIVADSILVRPTWIERASIDSPLIKTDIIIDPKMAFGVGSHETTQLALRALKDSIQPGQRVADIGCGSLILSILAAKLGAAHVEAVDNDPAAIENSEENRRLNQVCDTVEITLGSTDVFRNTKHSFDIVVANIICNVLLTLLAEMLELVRDDGILILSGLLEQDALSIESALQELGVSNWSQSKQGEWVCYVCSPIKS